MGKTTAIPIPSKEELYDLYIVKNFAVPKIAKLFGHANSTVAKWMATYGLKALKDSIVYEAVIPPMPIENTPTVLNELVPVNGEPIANSDDDDDLTGWNNLYFNQQRYIIAAGQYPTWTQKQLAEHVSVTEQTIIAWKCNPAFQDLLYDYITQQAKHHLAPKLLYRLHELQDTKRETQEDRKLIAQIAGLINDSPNINVNVAVAYKSKFNPAR
jgi:transposase